MIAGSTLEQPSGIPAGASSVPPVGGSTRDASSAAGAKTACAPGAANETMSRARGIGKGLVIRAEAHGGPFNDWRISSMRGLGLLGLPECG